MFQINLPPFDIKVTSRNGKKVIFDFIRRRYVAVTPEEWVRQHFTHFLVEHKRYPAGLLANEISLNLNGMSRRCDTVLYDRLLAPRMIIEYKAPHIPITEKVFSQICAYNWILHADYLIVSNGQNHYCCKMDYPDNSYHFLADIPFYEEL